ncbi:MAG: amidohydrolase [Chloroflexi bacterium]|nr:amidohydrolase [Chloroflexota bacterium]
MIIDCDTHAMLEDAFAYLTPEMAASAPQFVFNSADATYDVVEFLGRPDRILGSFPQPRTGNKLRGATYLDDRVEDLDRLGVQKQLVMSNFTGWWSYLLEPRLGAEMAHSHNVSMQQAFERYPNQFLGIALVALQDVDASIAELEWASANGFVAAVVDHAYPVREHPYGTSLGEHHELWPFFARAEALRMPLFIHNVLHGHSIANCPRLMPMSLDETAPLDAQVNMASLIYSGLLDDFPGLQFVVAEQGTNWIKPMAQALDARFAAKPVDVPAEDTGGRLSVNAMRKITVPLDLRARKNKLTPSHYFRTNFFWTIETEEPELAEAVEFLGAERFLFATDYPHDDPGGLMKWRDVELITANRRISDRDKERICSQNAVELFGLE